MLEDLILVFVVVLALAIFCGGVIRGMAAASFISLAIGAICGGLIFTTVISIFANQLLSLMLVNDGEGTIARYAALKAVLVALSQPTLSTVALSGVMILIAYAANSVARIGTDISALLLHFAAYADRSKNQ